MNSRHSLDGTSAEDARLYIYKYVNLRSPLDISQQVQWKDDEKQQLIDSDKLECEKLLDLVIYLTRRLREKIHAYRSHHHDFNEPFVLNVNGASCELNVREKSFLTSCKTNSS